MKALSPCQRMTVKGAALNYEISGTSKPGPALVLVHGFAASLESWHDVFPPMARQWPTARLDLLGSGFSDKPREDRYSPREQAILLAAFVGKLGFPAVVLIGHSLGGGIALLTALASIEEPLPFRIAGLVLIDSAGYPQDLPFQVAAIHNPISRAITSLLPATVRTRLALRRIFFVHDQITAERVSRYAYFLDLPGSRGALIKTAAHLAAAEVDSYSSAFRQLTMPTLIIWGLKDAVIPPQHAYRFASDIPGATLCLLADTGHVPHEERPEEVLRAVAAFMGRLP